MGLARESYPYLIAGITVGGLCLLLGFPWIGGTSLILSAGIVYFFRDPARTIPAGSGIIVSPADGRVTLIERGPEGENRISIFLSLFDVHVNRSPIAGRIESIRYRPGRFLPANFGSASRVNERNDITVAGEDGTIRFAQIAGVVARRIVCWKREGDRVAAGERIGLIQFGSRVDVELPRSAVPAVEVGARVRGGSSILARTNPPPAQKGESGAQTDRG